MGLDQYAYRTKQQNSSDYYYDDDLKFIENAIQLINEGYTVYYDCWW